MEVVYLEVAQEVVQEGHQDLVHLERSKNQEELDMSTMRAEETLTTTPNILT